MTPKKPIGTDQPGPDDENAPRPCPEYPASEDDAPIVEEPAQVYQMTKYISIPEYLEMEDAADIKHEYYKGEIFAMSGAKWSHNIIVRNLLIGLGIRLKGSPCQPLGSDQRIHIPANTLFTYPDISVFCGKPESLENDQMNALNPSVLVEVLSRSTRSYDKGAKFKLYRDIPTFKEYLLVDSERIYAAVHTRSADGRWSLQEYHDPAGNLSLETLGLQIPLSEIYEGSGLLP